MDVGPAPLLGGVSETAFIPLCMRAFETARHDAVMRDPESVRIVAALRYQCDRFADMPWVQLGTAIRTEIFDRETGTFLQRHPAAVVVNLGAGLCTRFGRVDNGQVIWIELDLEPVRQLRRRVFEETGRHPFLTASVLDFHWMPRVYSLAGNRPVLFLAEGLLMYFAEAEVRRLILAMADAFPGAEMLLEAMGRLVARNARRHPAVAKTTADFCWGTGTVREMESWSPRIRLLDEWYYLDYHRARWGWCRMLKLVPALHRQMKIGRLRFCA